jgi:hypothetical protein
MTRLFSVLALLLLLLLPLLAEAIAPAPAPPKADQTILPTAATATTLTGTGTGCTTPGGAGCTIILASTAVGGWPNVTIYVKNTGAQALTDVLIETSPDGSSWEEAVPGTFDGLATGTTKSANYLGHYMYIRVEARAAVTSSASVWVSGFRP